MGAHRLTLVMPEESMARLENLMSRSGSRDKNETISRALRFYEWVTSLERKGEGIYVKKPDGSFALVEMIFE